MNMYETSDFHLAITLCSLGFNISCINKTNPRRFIFEFERSQEIYEYVESYFHGDLRLDPHVVLLNAKLLKDRMYER